MSQEADKQTTREIMNSLARGIDEILNGTAVGSEKKWGFALLVFPLGKPPDQNSVNYVSNADRNTMRAALKELVARWERA